MKTLKLILISCACAIALAACSDPSKRPTEDSIIASEAMDVAEGLRKAYLDRDSNGMARLCTDDVYATIARDLKRFDSADLEFTVRWIEITREAEMAYMLVAWKGSWTTGETTQEKEGTVLFILKGKPLKASSIQRLSPFAQP